jgi:hypothetical protein
MNERLAAVGDSAGAIEYLAKKLRQETYRVEDDETMAIAAARIRQAVEQIETALDVIKENQF